MRISALYECIFIYYYYYFIFASEILRAYVRKGLFFFRVEGVGGGGGSLLSEFYGISRLMSSVATDFIAC